MKAARTEDDGWVSHRDMPILIGDGRWDLKYLIDANAADSATLASKLSARELAGGAEGVQDVEALDGR